VPTPELSTVKHYMGPMPQSVRMLDDEHTIAQGSAPFGGNEGDPDTEKSRYEVRSRVMGSYERLESDGPSPRKLATRMRARRSGAHERRRQQVYIAGFVQTSLPEEPLYPRRLRKCRHRRSCWPLVIGTLMVQTVRGL